MNILAVGAHPDDVEIYCYGTLAKYVKEGHNVFICHAANGCYGSEHIAPGELKTIRYNEASEAAAIIGAKHFSLDIDDLHVDSTDHNQILKLVNVIREIKPDVIITHYNEDYMDDHVQTSKLVMNASFAASTPYYGVENGKAEIVPLCPVFYMDTAAGVHFTPTEYVDITETLELKKEAFKCHRSQLEWLAVHDQSETMKCLESLSYQRGHECGVPHAEGFRACCEYSRMTVRRMLP